MGVTVTTLEPRTIRVEGPEFYVYVCRSLTEDGRWHIFDSGDETYEVPISSHPNQELAVLAAIDRVSDSTEKGR